VIKSMGQNRAKRDGAQPRSLRTRGGGENGEKKIEKKSGDPEYLNFADNGGGGEGGAMRWGKSLEGGK